MYKRIKNKKILRSCIMLGYTMSMILPTRTADAAMSKGSKFVGNIIAGSVPSDFGTYWNQVTPENATKWGRSCKACTAKGRSY